MAFAHPPLTVLEHVTVVVFDRRAPVGVGHPEQEFVAMGVPFRERGAIADELLEALHTLWTAEQPSEPNGYRDELIEAYRGRYRKIGITRTVAEPPRCSAPVKRAGNYPSSYPDPMLPWWRRTLMSRSARLTRCSGPVRSGAG